MKRWHWRITSVFVVSLIGSCVMNPQFWVEDLQRYSYVGIIFPVWVEPAIERIPGVQVVDVAEGGYEDLVYITIAVDQAWTMWIHTSSLGNLMETQHFRVERVGRCWESRRFTTLEAAVTYYRQSSMHAHCRTYQMHPR